MKSGMIESPKVLPKTMLKDMNKTISYKSMEKRRWKNKQKWQRSEKTWLS